MGRIKWFRSKDFIVVLRYIAAAVSAVVRVATSIGNGHRKKGGDNVRKRTIRKK